MVTTAPRLFFSFCLVASSYSSLLFAHVAAAETAAEISSEGSHAETATSTSTAAPASELPEVAPLAYPSAPNIEPLVLDGERRELLRRLLRLATTADHKERSETREKLCPAVIRRPDSTQAAIKAALTVTEADMHLELRFKNESAAGNTPVAAEFSFLVQMSDSTVLLRSSTPRFATEAAGVSVPFPSDHTRPIWLEGKNSSNMLVLIPSVRECGVRSVVLCPRNYVAPGKLAVSGWKPVSARYFIKTKADGLYGAPAGSKAKVVASVLGSPGVALPEQWSKESVTSTMATVTLKSFTPAESSHPFTPITLPFTATVESRLDFGTPEQDLRKVFSAASVEVSEFDLRDWPPVHIRTADLKVEPGACFQVTQFVDTQL